MRRSPLVRTLSLIAVLALFAAPASPQARTPHLLGAGGAGLSQAFAQFWSFLSGLWAKNGCWIDPNGQCIPESAPAADNGCIIDPNGTCAASPATAKNGCRIDPSGQCIPESPPAADNGCILDPNGTCASSPATAKNGCRLDPNGHCLP